MVQTTRRARNIRLLALAISAVAVASFVGFVATYLWGLQPVDDEALPQSGAISFVVTSGETAPIIAQRLYDQKLIRSRNVFVTYVNLNGLRSKLKTGVFSLKPNMSTPDIARQIAGGRTLTKRLVVPEGYQLSQIVQAAGKQGIPEADMKQALASPRTQSILATKPAGVSLEGYLFPDSYDVGASTTATGLVDIMINNFASKIGEAYVSAYAKQGLTLHQGLTIASMVEREVNIPADRPVVAQIFLKRFKEGETLGSDVTSEYASKLLGVPFSVDVNSPYNTRRFVGLPPGPICSPGLAAMDAVARPAATDYSYFLSGKDGKTYYARTYTEHQQNIVKYLN